MKASWTRSPAARLGAGLLALLAWSVATASAQEVDRPFAIGPQEFLTGSASATHPEGSNPRVPATAARPIETPAAPEIGSPKALISSAQTVGLFAVLSLVPAAVLMVSAFVRISVVLTLLRQALGSPQVPGNQVLMALSLLLTALVMWPVGEKVHSRAIRPFAEGSLGASEAWEAGTEPIKEFMIDQIYRTRHERYLTALHAHLPATPGVPEPTRAEQLTLRVIAPAFLLSELTTALFIGFAVYLPFLVIDLVVSAVLSAMGLFMLPPALVSIPLKLILFVLADGWMLVADMLLRSFGG